MPLVTFIAAPSSPNRLRELSGVRLSVDLEEKIESRRRLSVCRQAIILGDSGLHKDNGLQHF